MTARQVTKSKKDGMGRELNRGKSIPISFQLNCPTHNPATSTVGLFLCSPPLAHNIIQSVIFVLHTDRTRSRDLMQTAQ